MPRRVQDIVPGEKRSIRDIPLEENLHDSFPENKKISESIRSVDAEDIKEREIHLRKITYETSVVQNTPRHKSRKFNGFLLTSIIIIIIAALGYIASSYYTKAVFTIVPKSIPITVNSDYVVKHAPSNDLLSYELITVSDTQTDKVQASNSPQSSSKSKGKITMYNSFSSQPQRLIAGTRLVSSSGKIYKTTSSIIIPGSSTLSGKTTPGHVSVSIIADQAGQAYNISRSNYSGNLKVLLFKDSPKYDTVYGQLSSDITGGSDSDKKVVDPKTLATTTASIQSRLITALIERIQNSVPEGYVFYDTLKQTTFSPYSILNASSSNTALVSIQGTMSGVIFKKSDLIKKLAGNKTVSMFGDMDFDAQGLEDIRFNISNIKDFSATKKNTLIINAKGSMRLVGVIPVDEIKNKLAGSSLSQTESILKPYSYVIENGSGELTPPWSKVPSNINKITVIVEPIK